MDQENLQHFILSNRQIREDEYHKTKHYIIDQRIEPGLPLHYTFYQFKPQGLTEQSWIPNAVRPTNDGFIEQVVAEAEKLPEHCRNVTLYLHGFHHMVYLSYKLDVMSGMVNAYCTPDGQRTVGKFIFFSWPATQTRKSLDDRAYAQGRLLYENNAQLFKDLYGALKQKGIQFNLMAHSFGHHLLNGFLAGNGLGEQLFDQVYLFAADVPHGALSSKEGVLLKEKGNSQFDDGLNQSNERLYNLNLLHKVAGITHCYYCKYDRMLMASTNGEEHDTEEEVRNYLCLGTVGNQLANHTEPHKNIHYYNVLKLVEAEEEFSKAFKRKKILRQMDEILEDYTFKKPQRIFAMLSIVRKNWVELHRYSYYGKKIVQDVRARYGGNTMPWDNDIIT